MKSVSAQQKKAMARMPMMRRQRRRQTWWRQLWHRYYWRRRMMARRRATTKATTTRTRGRTRLRRLCIRKVILRNLTCTHQPWHASPLTRRHPRNSAFAKATSSQPSVVWTMAGSSVNAATSEGSCPSRTCICRNRRWKSRIQP